jgi:RNA polymerase sigma-70 factor (ECF subfamily)
MTAAQESFYIQQFKLGDSSSFQLLYQHYQKRMIGYGRSLFPNYEDDVKDAYQDIFIALWRSKDRLTVEKTLDFYLKRSIKNHMIRVVRKKLKYDAIPNENEDGCLVHIDETNALDSIIESEVDFHRKKIYEHQLSFLTKRERFLFTERFVHEKSVEEIMQEHQLARQTVYNMIYKSINKLKSPNSEVRIWA